MDDETEVIKKQMAETRESLAEKVEALENKVIDTVQTATDTVTTVKETVADTVESVKGGVRNAAESVKGALDIGQHARERPWTVFCGSVALGFVGGYLLTPRERDPRDRRWPDMSAGPNIPMPWSAAHGDGLPPPQAGTRPLEPPHQKHDERPGLLERVGERLEPAIDQLAEVAIGAAVGMIGKLLMESAPAALRGDLSGVIDQFTTALGGKPMPREPEARPEPRRQPAASFGPPAQDQPAKPHNRLSGTKGRGNGRSTS